MLHRVEFAFLFISFELLRLEGEQILLDLDLPQIDVRHEFHSKKAERNELFGQNHDKSLCREPNLKWEERLL